MGKHLEKCLSTLPFPGRLTGTSRPTQNSRRTNPLGMGPPPHHPAKGGGGNSAAARNPKPEVGFDSDYELKFEFEFDFELEFMFELEETLPAPPELYRTTSRRRLSCPSITMVFNPLHPARR